MEEIERKIHLAIYSQQKIIDGYREIIHTFTTSGDKNYNEINEKIEKYTSVINIHMSFISILQNL